MALPPLPSDAVFLNPRDIDVKCGRGRECFLHPGNSLLRIRVATKLDEYQNQFNWTLKAHIVGSVTSQFFKEGARFLKRDCHTKLWYDGGTKAAKERVGSAFRDSSKPNKVKCMEILKTQLRSKSHVGHILQSPPTANVGLLHTGSSSGASAIASKAASDDAIRISAFARDCECQGSNRTIYNEDTICMLQDIGSDDGMYSMTLIEDIYAIDNRLLVPLTQDDKELLASLDWEKGSP